MIDIKSDKEKVIRSLQELEFEFAQGNISKKTYNSQKRGLETKLETLETADRIKRLQGKGGAEKPLEYWTEKKEAEEEKQAKEELMKKFITSSSPSYPTAKSDKTTEGKGKVALTAILALIFISGIGFGIFLMKVPSESAAMSMTIDQSAFPVINNSTNMTNSTNKTTSTSVTKKSSSTSSGSSGTSNGGSSGGSTGGSSSGGSSGGNTGGSTGGSTSGSTSGSTGGSSGGNTR
ncbi:MAG TPA: hypothetical protein VGC02_01415 [Methanobacterium sp.]